MAVVCALIVFAGFARTYYLRFLTTADGLSTLVHAHGAVFTAWVVLFVVQVRLVAGGRTDIHRRLGQAGVILAALMVVLGTMTALAAARLNRYPENAFPDALSFLVIPLGDITLFAILFGLAWIWRRRPAAHKRLMLLATIGALLPAAIGRIPGIEGQVPAIVAVYGLLLLVGPVYDLVARRRIHPAFWIGAPLLFLSAPARLALAKTEIWHRIAAWLVG